MGGESAMGDRSTPILDSELPEEYCRRMVIDTIMHVNEVSNNL